MNKSSDRPSGLGRGRGRPKHQEVPPKAAVGKQSQPPVEKQPPPSEMEQEQDIEDEDAGCDCLVAQIMKDPSISGSEKKSLLVGETQKIIYSNCARSRVILANVRDHLEIEANRTRLEVGQYYDSLMVLLRQDKKETLQKIDSKASEQTAKVDKLVQELEKTDKLKELPDVTMKVLRELKSCVCPEGKADIFLSSANPQNLPALQVSLPNIYEIDKANKSAGSSVMVSLHPDFPRFRLSPAFEGRQLEVATAVPSRRQLHSTPAGSGAGSVLPEIPSASTIPDISQDMTIKLQEDLDITYQSTVMAGGGDDPGDVIRPFPLRVNSREDVTVTHIVSPSEFYVVTKKGENQRSKISKEVGESVTARTIQLLESPRVGDICLVPIGLSRRSNKWTSARLWSKGKVVEAFKQENQYRVFCYDTGHEDWFPESRIFERNSEVSGNTAFAVKCSLAVVPAGGDPDDWSPDALKSFREFVSAGVKNAVDEVVSAEGESDDYDEESCPRYTVTLKSIMDYRKYITDVELDATEMLVLNGYCSKEAKHFPGPIALPYKGNSKYFDHSNRDFADGSVYVGRVAPGGNPSAFCFSCTGPGAGSSSVDMERMLQREYGTRSAEGEMTSMVLPRVDQPCVVNSDDEFNRAKILDLTFASVDRPAEAKLLLVDTGEVLTGVDVSDLRLLKQCFMQYPMMAVKMSLSGVEKPDTREWSQECAAYFNEWSRCGNPVRISVDNRHADMAGDGQPAAAKSYSVTAYAVKEDHDLCINADLVAKKLAKLQNPSGPHYRTVKYYHSKPKHCGTDDGDLEQVLGGCFSGKVLGVEAPNCVYFMLDAEEAEEGEDDDRVHQLQVEMNRYFRGKPYRGLVSIPEEDETQEDRERIDKVDLDHHLEYVAVYHDCNWRRGRILANQTVLPVDEDDRGVPMDKAYSVLLVDAGKVVRNLTARDMHFLPVNFREMVLPVCKLTFPEISHFKDQKPMEELARVLKLQQDYTMHVKTEVDSSRLAYLMDMGFDDSKGYVVDKAFLMGSKVPNPTSQTLEEDRPYAFVSNALAYGIALPSCANPIDSNNNLEGESWRNPPDLDLTTYRGKAYCVDGNGIVHFVPQDFEEQLYQISDILDRHYRDSVPKGHDRYWYPGQICAAHVPVYNSWYRAKVVQVYPTEKRATVFLIDYGQDQDVMFSSLRKDVGNVIQFQKLSYQLVLRGVTWVGPRGEAQNNLHQKIVDTSVEVVVHEVKPKLDPDVSGIVTVKKNGVNVAILLKAEGAAKFVEEDTTDQQQQ